MTMYFTVSSVLVRLPKHKIMYWADNMLIR